MNPSNEVPEPLVLAAIDRAVRHRERETTPSWEVYAHMGFPRRSGGARAARRQLDALTASSQSNPSPHSYPSSNATAAPSQGRRRG
jgi:hypothetical protein